MKKNIRNYKVNGKQFSYVLDSINVTDYDGNEIAEVTDKERVKYFFDCFNAEYDSPYMREVYPNLQDRISQYLQCLPNCIHVAFRNYEILQIGKSWGYCKTERKENQFIANWFNYMALRLLQLKDYFEI